VRGGATIADDEALMPKKKGTMRANMQIISHVVQLDAAAAELTRVVFYDPLGGTTLIPDKLQEAKMADTLPIGLRAMAKEV
jgi:hypothetical protein